MGREYFGDVEGKFGFGVQSSDDIQNLINIDYDIQHRYLECYCLKEDDDMNYCKDCYNSYDDHYQAAFESGCIDDDQEILFEEDTVVIYTITKEHQTELEESLKELEEKLPINVVQKFNEIKNNKNIIDGYSLIFKDVASEMNKYENRSDLFFRYKLGIQVNYILNEKDTCFLYCESY